MLAKDSQPASGGAIAFAAKHSPADADARDHLVAEAIARRAPAEMRKQLSARTDGRPLGALWTFTGQLLGNLAFTDQVPVSPAM